MAKLESTPYRVFYLINCPENTPDFRFLWNLDSVNDGKGNCTNKYTSLIATMKVPNDFSSVVVEATEVTECRTYNEELGTSSSQTEYKSYPPMPWDDIEDGIVEIINKSYDREDRKERRDHQIRYADSIQSLFEDPDRIKLSVDNEGYPTVEVTGLPYLYNAIREELASVKVTFDPRVNDYKYTMNSGSDYYEPVEATVSEIHNYIRQSKRYDEARNVIEKLFEFDYYDDDWDD